MATVSSALRHVNGNLKQLLPARVIRQAAQAAGHRWRQRKLGPVETVLVLVLQLLAGNVSLAEARAMAGYAFSCAALAEARARLPVKLLENVLSWLIEQSARQLVALDPSDPKARRVIKLDAVNYYTPDTKPLARRYRRPGQKRCKGDYPQLRTLSVFDLASGVLLAQHAFASDRHESPQLRRLLKSGMLRSGDIVIFDRGFVSYENLCLLTAHGVDVVARLAKGLIAKRTSRRRRTTRLGKGDALVQWDKPARRPTGSTSPGRWRRLPQQLALRQVRISGKTSDGYRSRRLTIITSLRDEKTYRASQISDWYRRRWEIETDLRHLKSTLKLEFLRTKSLANIKRELLLRAIAYNLVRLAMLAAAKQRRTQPQRISFADACRWLRLRQANHVQLLKLLTIPQRQRRGRPRKLKYRGKNYRLLTTRPAPQRQVAK